MKLYLDSADSALDLGRFESWLRKSQSVEDAVSLRLFEDASTGALGGADYIEVVCEVLSTVTGVVSAYVAWKQSHRHTPELLIVVNDRPPVRIIDGSAVEIQALGLELDGGNTAGEDGADPSA